VNSADECLLWCCALGRSFFASCEVAPAEQVPRKRKRQWQKAEVCSVALCCCVVLVKIDNLSAGVGNHGSNNVVEIFSLQKPRPSTVFFAFSKLWFDLHSAKAFNAGFPNRGCSRYLGVRGSIHWMKICFGHFSKQRFSAFSSHAFLIVKNNRSTQNNSFRVCTDWDAAKTRFFKNISTPNKYCYTSTIGRASKLRNTASKFNALNWRGSRTY